jgi:hypothetical protein
MYGYGYRYNSGLVIGAGGGAPFANTYSLSFDGIDDYLDVGNLSILNSVTSYSSSSWIKCSSFATGKRIWGRYVLGDFHYLTVQATSGNIAYSMTKSFPTAQIDTVNGISLNTWTNVITVYDGTLAAADRLKIYINGVLQSVTSINTAQTSTGANTANMSVYIAAINGLTNPFTGNIDEVAFYDYALDSATALSIGGTIPTDLSLLPTPPLNWYRNGDNGSWKSPQWLIPNNENKDKVSNYSFAFDGIDDKVSIGTALDLGINSTLSFWIKRGRISTSEVWFGEDSYSSDYLVTITSSTVLYFRINTSYVGWNYAAVKSILNNTTEWVNVCIVRSGNSVELFLNGISYGTGNSNAGTPGSTVTRFDTIGASPYGLHTFAQFDEIAAWSNNTVNPVDIYNGGEPTTISGAVAHYKMGEDANFTSNWLVDNSALTNYSKRSFDFDGIDDKIELGTQSLGITGAISVSAWVKIPTTNTGGASPFIQVIFGEETRYNPNRNWALFWRGGTNLNGFSAFIYDSSGVYTPVNSATPTPNDNQWHHLMFTYTGDTTTNGLKLFVDGVKIAQATSANGGLRASSTVIPTIGGVSNSTQRMFEGNIDEVSIFNSVVDIANVWDGSGQPIDVSAVSGIVSNYRMGEDSSFNGTNWTVPDNAGSNNGTSNAMDVDDLVGEAPNYSGGGISSGMTIEDRVGEAPNSTSNALSFNMDKEDRIEETP